ncbi:MAG: alpha/beta hydrolase [Deltaproteobacteria bacterium]|nr:alpha/beta hydrolase [Deltaproteobacteria bacterium]
MSTERLFENGQRQGAIVVFLLFLIIWVGASWLGSLVQRDFGNVAVSNVNYENFNGILVRAKLLRPTDATPGNPMPGIVYIHGYQNNRETGDAYCLELARRGFVVLNIDAIGRGNSGNPNDPKDPDFDLSYGGKTSLAYLKSLPFVNPEAVGLMGHSLGAEMAYGIALEDPTVRALAITGFAYTTDASGDMPRNMLMIIGKWDEFRKRMTGTRDIEKEWMNTPQTQRAIPFQGLRLGVTYGDFLEGTARRVFAPRVTHVQESHCREAVAETLEWMSQALRAPEARWIDADQQIWPVKEWATLIAMLACFASLMPLGLILLRTGFFASIRQPVSASYACSAGTFFKYAAINGLLMWLYLPLIFILFGLHIYVIHIDRAFPMMMVNGVVWWFFWINVIGFFLFRRWYKRRKRDAGLTAADMGLSFGGSGFFHGVGRVVKTILLGVILCGFAYGGEHLLEQVFIVDFRFIFPFASDLTRHRAWLCLRYFPFLLVAFLLMGIFLHGQLRLRQRKFWFGTFAAWSLANLVAVIVPILLFLCIQYVPLFTTGWIPLVGPGGMFVPFILNLFHIIGVLVMVVPLSTWFFQITGKIYMGALVNAMLVTWMFISSQVIAPIPV